MNDAVARNDVGCGDSCSIDLHTHVGGDGDVLTFDCWHIASSDISSQDRSRHYVVGQDLHEKIFVLWQQKLVNKTGWQCCEGIVGRCEHCERAFTLKGLDKAGRGNCCMRSTG